MNARVKIRVELLLLSALVLVLAFTRFAGLGERPLSDAEAVHALSAAVGTQVASDFWTFEQARVPVSSLYNLPTHIIFQFFGAQESTARIVPAFAGFLLLVLVVFFWKADKPGSKLIWLLILGLSPVVLTSSRTASGDILAATSVFIIFLALLRKESQDLPRTDILIALALGSALATGSSVFKALTGIAIGVLVMMVFRRGQEERRANQVQFPRLFRTVWLVPATCILILSGFGGFPEGLQSFALALEGWLQGWIQPSGSSVLEVILFLVTTEPLILIFGIAGAVRLWGKQDRSGQLASLWTVGAGLFIVVYPGRTPGDLIWLILPLSYLAVHAIQDLVASLGGMSSNQEVIGLVALLAVFAASGALSFVAYGTGNVLTINPSNPNLILLLFIALGIMGLSVLVFFGIGWSWSIVIQAVSILWMILALAQSFSSLWRLNFTQAGYHVTELWWQITPSEGLPRMVTSLENAALAQSGQRHSLPIQVQENLPASFAWALRDFQKATAVPAFGTEASPVILTLESNIEVSLPADYVGQSLGIRELRAWESALPPDLMKWWIAREAPTAIEHWVLWLRVDIASFGEIDLDR